MALIHSWFDKFLCANQNVWNSIQSPVAHIIIVRLNRLILLLFPPIWLIDENQIKNNFQKIMDSLHMKQEEALKKTDDL